MSSVINQVEENVHRGRGRPRCEESKTRIMEAALELLEEMAFADITSDGIAERAGASKATIYRWWPNKVAVLVEALREAVAEELPFPDTGDVREDIRLQLRNFVKLLTGRRARVFKAFVAAAQSDPEVSEAFESVWRNPRRATVRAGLKQYRGRGLRADVDIEMVIDCMYGPLYYRLLVGSVELTQAYADSLADFVLQRIC